MPERCILTEDLLCPVDSFWPCWASASHHIAEAITDATQAIDHGKTGHPNVLATHAELALANARASEKAKANSHTEEAIKHLEQAIDEGKMGHADVATTHAEAALTHLEQVK
jgi:hypothetical protein